MNKALEGYSEERTITIKLNKNPELISFLPIISDKYYAIHVTNDVFGKINNQKIRAKADIYFATGFIDYKDLIEKDFYLSEDDVELYKLKKIPYSGLSIKLPDSNYTIFKISPTTFIKIFGNNILGAGASIYCKKDFYKNQKVLDGWGIETTRFQEFYCNILEIKEFNLNDPNILSKIKKYSNSKIEELILSDEAKINLIFKGLGNFDEPYTAHWIFKDNKIIPNNIIPFIITTGSGRSKNIYTIVVKPK